MAKILGGIIANKATSNNSTLGTIKNAWNLSSKLTNSAKTTSKEV